VLVFYKYLIDLRLSKTDVLQLFFIIGIAGPFGHLLEKVLLFLSSSRIKGFKMSKGTWCLTNFISYLYKWLVKLLTKNCRNMAFFCSELMAKTLSEIDLATFLTI
jgi:hypothetical protein